MWADSIHAPIVYGIASGDPLEDAVIIWPKIEDLGIGEEQNIIWELSLNPYMTGDIITSGTSTTSAERD